MTRSMTLAATLAALALAAGQGAPASEAVREAAAANFLEADVDANGALTLSEFTVLIDLNAEDGIGRAAMIRRHGRYATAFQRLDANADALVTPEEIQALAAAARR